MKTEYYITFYVRGNDEVEDEYPTIAEFKTLKESIDFAKKTVGTVEVVGTEYNDETKLWDKTEEHIGFLDGVQQYHDEGYSQ
jgi:hypothetical protein